MSAAISSSVVEKEFIHTLTFPNQDVITNTQQASKRQEFLMMGMKLGNNHKRKVKIIFEDMEGKKMVETTIWAVTEKNVALKGGQLIPIHRIHGVYVF